MPIELDLSAFGGRAFPLLHLQLAIFCHHSVVIPFPIFTSFNNLPFPLCGETENFHP